MIHMYTSDIFGGDLVCQFVYLHLLQDCGDLLPRGSVIVSHILTHHICNPMHTIQSKTKFATQVLPVMLHLLHYLHEVVSGEGGVCWVETGWGRYDVHVLTIQQRPAMALLFHKQSQFRKSQVHIQ